MNKVNWKCGLLCVVLLVGCGDDDLPAGDGVVWNCLGMISQTDPASMTIDPNTGQPGPGIMEVIQVVGPSGQPITECGNGNLPPSQVISKCQDDCDEAWNGNLFWQAVNTLAGIDTPSCTITDVTNTGFDCSMKNGALSTLLAAPAQTSAPSIASMSVNVSGNSGSTGGTGTFAYSIGQCTGDSCPFQLATLTLTANGPFNVGGQTVSSASITSAGAALGTFVPSTGIFTIPANAFSGQINFVLGGRRGSMLLPNPQPLVGGVLGGAVQFAGTLAMGDRSVSFTGSGLIAQHPPTVQLIPGDSLLECGANHKAPITLTAQASDLDNDIDQIIWSFDGIEQPVTSDTVSLNLSIGVHQIGVAVRDSRVAGGSDFSQITVSDTTKPVFTFVPPAITISSCTAPAIGKATAVDSCGSVVVTSNAPAVFHVGTTVVTWTATDDAGNKATATQTVTVILGDDASCCPVGSNVIVGTSNNDTLNGTPGNDCILGKGGQDIINGMGGNDTISGGEGDDIIDGGPGADSIWGGGGQDTIRGGTGNDFIDGGPGDDHCYGGDNDDVIRGGDGQDQLFGEGGNDKLFGEAGDDRLDGGDGDDQLNGGGLHDVCIGGPGNDTFTMCQTAQQ